MQRIIVRLIGLNAFIALGLMPMATAFGAEGGKPVLRAELLGVQRIWSAAPHNAFTDLVRWHDAFYCAFREGQGHAGDRGRLRVIRSTDGIQWRSTGLLEMDRYDLRDAALSITPDDRMMLMGGAQEMIDGERATGTFVSFSTDGGQWSEPQIVIPPGRWLWRVTWQDDWAYGVAYAASDGRPFSSLHRSRDGRHFETVAPQLLGAGGWPTEARIRFADDRTAYCLHRRDGEQGNTAYLGSSPPPYDDWTWRDLGVGLGGPNFVRVPSGEWIAAGRRSESGPRTEIAELDLRRGELRPLLTLPSGGDTSYPGLVWFDDMLWVSYYSSHEQRTNVYLARVRLVRAS
jgi:hypothetical protein